MKKISLYTALICSLAFLYGQNHHVVDLYTSEGTDLIIVRGIAATQDSVYALTDFNGNGDFFRVSLEGTEEYDVITSFNSSSSTNPLELKIKDNVIYGSTSYADGFNGQLFSYSLDNYSYSLIHNFTNDQASRNEIKYLTDSVIWGHSQSSGNDWGSVFTINYDGTGYTKIYEQADIDDGGDPVDIVISDGRIFIACYNYGGIPYDDGGGSTYSGSITSVDISGNSYLKIKQGEDLVGTQPRALAVYNNKLYGLFEGAGTDYSAKLFSVNFDGSGYTQLYDFDGIGRGDLIVDDGKIVGITTDQLFSYDPSSNEVTILNTFSSEGSVFLNSGPVKIDNGYVVGFQKGESDASILSKWINLPPNINNAIEDQIINEGESLSINLSEYFSDPEQDEITFGFSLSNEEGIEASITDEILTITGNPTKTIEVTYKAIDQFGAESSSTFELEVNAPTEQVSDLTDLLVQEGFTSAEIDLNDFFQDRNGDVIDYTVSSSNNEVVVASISSGILTLTEGGIGISTITVEATDTKSDPISTDFEIKVNGSPEILNQIEDIIVNEGFSSEEIDLTEFVSDPNSDVLTYEASVANETVLTTSISGDILTISELGIGSSDISISIDDQNGGTNELVFKYTINGLPIQIDDLGITQSEPGFGKIEVDLSNKFSDPDDDPLSFSVRPSDPTLIDASIDGTNLTITEVSAGSASVNLIVSDDRGGSIELVILDLILGAQHIKDNYYPNPASSHITFNDHSIKQIEILKLNGSLIKKLKSRNGYFNINDIDSGIYLVRYIIDGDINTRKLIVK